MYNVLEIHTEKETMLEYLYPVDSSNLSYINARRWFELSNVEEIYHLSLGKKEESVKITRASWDDSAVYGWRDPKKGAKLVMSVDLETLKVRLTCWHYDNDAAAIDAVSDEIAEFFAEEFGVFVPV